MELNLLPQLPDQTIFEGEGGAYYSWSTSKFPLLGEAKVGAGKLVLYPGGFVLPHYADSAKIGFVLQGSCTVGFVWPNATEEKVFIIKKGDAIPVPLGVSSWWFNGGESEMVIVFLGETSKAYIPGQFTYFFFTGTLGSLGGFSNEFIGRVYNLNEEESEKLRKSQTGVLIIKLEKGITIPQPTKDVTDQKIFTNIDKALPDFAVKDGGLITSLTSANLPLLGRVGLGASLVKLDANAVLAPMYTTDSFVQIIYVTRGGGQIQIVGVNGKNALDTKVQAGELYVVPRFFAAATIADGEGMEFLSVMTSADPVFGQLGGNTSVWKAFSQGIRQAALGVTPEFEQLFNSKIEKSTIIVPPKN